METEGRSPVSVQNRTAGPTKPRSGRPRGWRRGRSSRSAWRLPRRPTRRGAAVPAGVVERMLANAQRAPSAGFSQGWAVVVLEGREQTARVWATTCADDAARAAFRWQGLFRATLVVVPLAHKQAYLDRYAEPDKGWTD